MGGKDEDDGQLTGSRLSVERTKFIVCLVGFLDLFGVSMVIPLLQSHAKDLGASPSVTGLIGSVYGILQLFSSPIMGKWSDLVGHRSALILCLILSGCSYAVLGFSSSLYLLILSRIPTGLFKHSQTISKAYLADVIPPEERPTVYGQFNAISSIGFIIGPTVGGHLAELSESGFLFVCLLASIAFTVSSGIVKYCLPTGNRTDSVKSEGNFSLPSLSSCKDIFQAFSKVNWRELWDLLLVNLFLGFAAIMLRANFTRMMIERFETTPKTNGYIISFGGLLSTLCSFTVGNISKFYNNNSRLFFHSALLYLIGLIGLACSPNIFMFALLQIPLSFSSSINRVVSLSLIVERGGHQDAGGIMGLNQSLMAISRTLSPVLAGILLEMHPMGPVWGSCVFVIFGTLAMKLTSKENKHPKIS